MSHGHWHYYDETERKKWQDPESVLMDIGLKPGTTFMDIGCGEGFFTFPAAHLVGASGKVYALDRDEAAMEEIRRRAAAEGLNNLELRVGSAEEIEICRACADTIFFGTALHDFQNPARVLENARKMLKPGGRLVNLDWKKTNMSFGPPLKIRFDEATASKLMESAGFAVESTKDSGPYHYLMVAKPKG